MPEISLRHRLRIAREEAGLDQGQLADLIGTTRLSVSNAERGRTTQPRRILMNAWALATGVPVSWLINGDTPADPDGPDGGVDECARRDSNPKPSDP